MAEYVQEQFPKLVIPAKIGKMVRRREIPIWEVGFAVTGLFLCLDAGIRTVRLLSGTLGPIQNTRVEANFAEGSALTQILLFIIYLVSVVLLLMHSAHQLPRILTPRLFWLLPVLAMLSVLWSGAPTISLRRAAALLGSAVFGLYLATRYSRAALLRLVLAVSAIAIVLSFLVGIALPAYAIDGTGAWQGVFGQKNQLGQFMALSAALWLLYAASARQNRVWAGFALLSAMLVLLSHSATAVVLLAVLIALLIVVRLWRLRYGGLIPVIMIFAVIGGWIALRLINPETVLSLLGRDSTLTGRTQLWSLVWQMVPAHFWFGYGYGGFWLGFDGPSAPVWIAAGWNPPNAHNGFLDLMVDLGAVGLSIFVASFVAALRKACLLVRRRRTLDAVFPLVVLVFLLVSNITESYLVTYNAIAWVLLVAMTVQLHEWWQRRPIARQRPIRYRPKIAREHAALPARIPTRTATANNAPQEEYVMKSCPTVSAIMPTYNAMPHLKEAIASVVNQTFRDWELIIVDDASTDGTAALLAKYKDSRIKVHRLEKNGGSANARNIALQYASGKYIAPCDSDDLSDPARFAKQVAFLESHPEIHVVASQMKYFWKNEPPHTYLLYPENSEAIQRRFARGKMAVPFGAAMIRAWCFERFGPFADELRRAQDLEWFLRVRRFCNFYVLSDFLYQYRHQAKGSGFKKWMENARYDRYAVYHAETVSRGMKSSLASFEQFSRRRRTQWELYTWDVARFINFWFRSHFAARRLK